MSKTRFSVQRICMIGVLAALYFALTMVSIKAGNLRITFASLPVVISAILFGPLDAVLIAAIGEFFNQLLSYGLMPTTVLWLIPPLLRGLLIGLCALPFLKVKDTLAAHYAKCYIVCVIAALLVTVANTIVIYLDSKINGYYTFAYVFGSSLLRFITSFVTALAVTTIAIPMVRLLRKQSFITKFLHS